MKNKLFLCIFLYFLLVLTVSATTISSNLEKQIAHKEYQYLLKKIIGALKRQIQNLPSETKILCEGIVIEKEDKLKDALRANFEYSRTWDFVAYFEDLLISKIKPKISINELYSSWKATLDSVETHLTEIMAKDKRLSYSKQKKTTSQEMLLIIDNLSNLPILSTLELSYHGASKNNYIFLKNERILFYEINNWFELTQENLRSPCSRSYTIKSKLVKELLANNLGVHDTSFLYIKDRMVKNVLSKISGEINREIDIQVIIQQEISDTYHKLVSFSYANREAIIDLFQDSLPHYISFTLPKYWGLVLHNSSLERHPDEHFQTYLDNINTWRSYHQNTIKNLSNTLKINKKNPDTYLINKQNLYQQFDNAANKETQETLKSILEMLLTPTTLPKEISITTLEKQWQLTLDKDALRVVFDQLFEELGEQKWVVFQNSFMNFMPTEQIVHLAIEAAQTR